YTLVTALDDEDSHLSTRHGLVRAVPRTHPRTRWLAVYGSATAGYAVIRETLNPAPVGIVALHVTELRRRASGLRGFTPSSLDLARPVTPQHFRTAIEFLRAVGIIGDSICVRRNYDVGHHRVLGRRHPGVNRERARKLRLIGKALEVEGCRKNAAGTV